MNIGVHILIYTLNFLIYVSRSEIVGSNDIIFKKHLSYFFTKSNGLSSIPGAHMVDQNTQSVTHVPPAIIKGK